MINLYFCAPISSLLYASLNMWSWHVFKLHRADAGTVGIIHPLCLMNANFRTRRETWTRPLHRIDDCRIGKQAWQCCLFRKINIGTSTNRWSNTMQNKVRIEIKDVGFRKHMGLPPLMVTGRFKENGWNFVYSSSHTFFGSSILRKHS